MSAPAPEPVLEVENLVKHYPVGGGPFAPRKVVHALDGVSLRVARGETLAIVGESGCGKSTLARCLMRLEDPTGGTIRLDGTDITHLDANALRPLRRRIQIVFQDPYASLNPRWSIGTLMTDPLRLHTKLSRGDRRRRAAELLAIVGLGEEFMERYPHELSGGQRQRVAIARALAVEPDVIVCDEPVSALDVSIQAQVINLLMRLRQQFGIALVFISHDLSLVKHIADRIAVMYLGQVVELADAARMRDGATHPYSRALFAAAPTVDPDPGALREAPIGGDVPSPLDPPSGCRFHTRCAFARKDCAATAPPLRAVEGRAVRCHYAGEIDFARWEGSRT
jgi:oligopeptide/dipeptide ABC transporter ATP-binding protein